ncbi:hypothetical protein ACIQNU_12040 [Streptomyces sp. NPDC091292]|uniref:hypothetical protein n=1 Tax=Streptomyces sp. NPDC091292 TaxID=3365991 RepID=UPI00381FDB27
MNRPARLVPAALVTTAALLLTACGSGDEDGSSSDKIKGADRGSSTSSPSPSTSAASDGRPEIPFPSTFTMNFERWTNSDPKLQAILNDGKEALRANHAAIIEADPDATYVAFYNSGAALDSSKKWINGYVKTDDSLIGVVRVFEPQVSVNSSGLGVLFYCVDEGKGFTKNRKTGKVVGTPDGTSPNLQYRTTLEKTSQGVWKTRSVETERGACGQ